MPAGLIAPGPPGLGWDEGWAQAAAHTEVAGRGARAGRVVRTHRVGFDVVTADGTEFAVTRARHRDPMAAPATGDWVVLADDDDIDEPVLVMVLPRRTAVVRRDPADRALPQVLAANADVVAVVHGADRPVSTGRLERQLAVAHGSGAEVLVVLTKADLDPQGTATEQLRQAIPGQELLVTASADGRGIEELDARTGVDRTLVLLGESGAGKSTLVNAVLGHEALATGGVREGDAKGRHTTTRRTLLPLPRGGALLDTPGVRAIGLWPGWDGLDGAFPRIAAAAGDCRFGDCRHRSEPGCAVREAVAEGDIPTSRLDAWHRLVEELDATRAEIEQKDWR